jgi:hypothetical protein
VRPEFPYGGSGDSRSGKRALDERFRRHAASLVANRRSPLYARLMSAAADDLQAHGVVTELFDGIPVPPGSVPQLRLLASLHQLVLGGGAPELARFYPSAGGHEPPEHVWDMAAASALRENFDWIRARLARTVQTNEPGRSAVLFAALLWLTSRYELPVRLLEVGASAGLNLLVDRYCYVIDGGSLGDPASPVRFEEPWQPRPAVDIRRAAALLRISARAGCDRAPLDPRDPEDRLRLISYIWPDELERIERIRRALDLAATSEPVPIATSDASDWLPPALAERRAGELTVVWHSLFRQYVTPTEWAEIEQTITSAQLEDPARPVAWVGMEPGFDHTAGIVVTFRGHPSEAPEILARANDHGPMVVWQPEASPIRARPGPR